MLGLLRSVSTSLVAACLLLAGMAGAQAQPVHHYTFPEQSLGSSLRQLGMQGGLNVLFDGPRVEGIVAPAIDTQGTADQVLSRLLEGSGYTHQYLNEHTVVLSAENGKESPLVSAAEKDETLKLAQYGVPSPLQGEGGVEDGKNRGNRERLVEEPVGSATAQKSISEVVVTGSRLRRTGDEGPAPVIIFDRDNIDKMGAASVSEVLRYLPQQPFVHNEQFNFAGSQTVRLRGLGTGTTLVLINGRRTVTSALTAAGNYFDVSSIPLAAVERIDVLSDSASAVYGADAVGGVINVVLKQETARPTLDLSYGAASGGANERRASLALGTGQRYRASIVMDAFEREYLIGNERARQADQDYRRYGAADLRSSSANPGNVASLTTANLPELPSRFAAVPIGSTGAPLTPAEFLATAGQRNLESLSQYQSIIPEAKRLSAFVTASATLTERTELFAELFYTDRDSIGRSRPPTLSGATVPTANPFNPFGVPVAVSYLFADLPAVESVAESKLKRGVAGVKGDFGRWDWEVSALVTDEDGISFNRNALDSARVAAALGMTDRNAALNLFTDGLPGSESLLNSLITTPTLSRYESKAMQSAAQLRRHLFTLRSGKVEAVLGAEARKEEMLINTTLFIQAERRSSSAYSEVRIPVVGPGMRVPYARTIALTLAARYDDYDDFGDTVNPQYGLEWYPFETLLLRASFGTSFRAPSLFELYTPATSRPSSIADPRRGNELAPIQLLQGGNPDLKAEESRSLTAGFVFMPEIEQRLRFSVSYWQIEQDQRVQSLNPPLILANEAEFPDRVVRSLPTPGDVAVNRLGRLVSVTATSLNFGRLETKGIDAAVSLRFNTKIGTISPSVMSTWVSSFDAADFPNTPAVDRVGIANLLNGAIPRWRASGTLDWKLRGVGLSISARFSSSYRDANNLGQPVDRRIPSQTLLDLQGSINTDQLFAVQAPLLRGVKLRFGITNLLDKEPNFSEVGGSLGIDPSQSDVRQRFGYISVSKVF